MLLHLHQKKKIDIHNCVCIIQNGYLCIIANRSSVVRALVGDRKTLSSSALVSSVSGDITLSLGVLAVDSV